MQNSPTYQGHRLYTDQDLESLLNAVSLWIAAAQIGVMRVTQFDSSGNEVVSSDSSASASANTNVPGSASSVTLLALNSSRKGVLIDNNSSEDLYVTYGATSTTTAYTKRIKPYESWEPVKNYTGVISGIWGSGVGFARISELT